MDEEYKMPAEVAEWVKCIGCAMTISDKDGMALYMSATTPESSSSSLSLRKNFLIAAPRVTIATKISS